MVQSSRDNVSRETIRAKAVLMDDVVTTARLERDSETQSTSTTQAWQSGPGLRLDYPGRLETKVETALAPNVGAEQWALDSGRPFGEELGDRLDEWNRCVGSDPT
ncbi:uncharacterized protein SPSK_11003 [Sporothrix schenckii 1099-18]|uniref:Uncharacterized protein n=1 Tax=Sporothrix schenckii 1099-18 TaxID=1397361 RepID=A0A0F2M1T5_SPOSC|nr:uncharacterized protein SPSK_11003 [Sporothrix schenckii 1099-18]KJR83667.1 hypothetical protein SPSK_11003 [Sporothrix schenckii 1099-18]